MKDVDGGHASVPGDPAPGSARRPGYEPMLLPPVGYCCRCGFVVETRMGVTKAVPAAAVLALLLLSAGTGCSSSSPVSNRRLIEHQAFVDFSGLAPAEQVSAVKVSCALPRSWNPTDLKKTPLYAHQQWKSPSGRTGVGVVHIRLPIPLSEGMLLWLAKREYAKANNDGKVIGEWKDEVGRSWFEAENN